MGQCFFSNSATIVAPVHNTHLYVKFTTFINAPWCAGAPNGTKAYVLENEPTTFQCVSLTDAMFKLRERQASEIKYVSIYNTRTEITYVFTRNALSRDEVNMLVQLPKLNYVDIVVYDEKHAHEVLHCRSIETIIINGIQTYFRA